MTNLTYEQLFDILRREKSRDELQQLEQDFYARVRAFLKEKEDAFTARTAEGLTSLTAQRAQIEYNNVKKIVKELYERRERKIITLSIHRTRTEAAVIDTDTLLPEEQKLFDTLVEQMITTRKETLAFLEETGHVPPIEAPAQTTPAPEPEPEVASGDTPVEEPTTEGLLPVKFLGSVPKFVGKNLEIFGPFQEGETTKLPEKVAQILLRKGRVEVLEQEQTA